ncbi:polymorphic toxin-type HINT domain-containing protein [Deinococcus metallilatus]|nr:polymorphic toxin-type HINT domain-containing protein [Deinococcus metallilatus]
MNKASRPSPPPQSGERRRRLYSVTLASLFLTLTQLPGAVVLAAPQVFARVGPGASGLPLQVTAFSDPSFGELSDAVNVATGNAYVDLGQVNRNNTNTTATPNTGAVVGGATSPNTSLSGSFNVNGVLRLIGFDTNNPNVPQEWALGVGDGGYQYYRRATDDEINNAPTWINERYAAIRGSAAFFISKPQTSLQVDETWIVQYRLGNGQYVAHYYDHSGNRTTFWHDGEYADYSQTPHEQYRGAAYASDPEGSNSPRTEFTYTSPGNGHLAKVRDSWGRTTTYEWDEGAGVVAAINILLQNENDNGSWRRRVEYAYEIVGNQRVVTYMVFRTYDARNQRIGRWFDLNYRTGTNGEVLLYQVIRPALADGSEAQQMGPYGRKTSTYDYDAQNRVTRVTVPGEPDMTFTYAAGGAAGGTLVTQKQGDDADPLHREIYLHFTPEGWLRRREVRDWNSATTETRFLVTDYWYNATGQVLALNLPSGMQYQYSYDRHGNRTRETTYLSQRRWQDGVDGDQLRTTWYEYDRDNRMTKEVAEGRSGQGRAYDQLSETTFNYGNNERQLTYRDFDAANIGGQRFTANREVEEARVIDGSLRRKFFTGVDVYGRIANTRLHLGNETDAYRTVQYGFWDGSTNLNNRVQVPDAGGNGDWADNRWVRSYGDLVASKTVTGRNITDQQVNYAYDEFGNTTLQQDINDYVGRWDGATAVQRTRETFEAFDGFGNKVWRRVLSQASGQDYNWWEENKTWTYYATGELRAASDGHPGLGVRTLTDYTYEQNPSSANFGRLLKVQVGEGTGTAVSTAHQTTDYGYDPYGRVKTTRVDGFTTTLDYDTLDRVVKTTNPDGSYRWVRYNEGGAIHREVTKNVGSGEMTTWHDVDSVGREYFTVYPDGSSVRTYYDAFDRPIKISDARLTMVSGDDRSSYLVYDTAGNLTKKLDPALVTATGQAYTDARRPYAEYGYDLLDRRTYEAHLLFGGTVSPTNMIWPTNAGGMATRTDYDALDHPIRVTDNEGYATILVYDNSGNLTTLSKQVWKGNETDRDTVHTGFDWVTIRTAYDAVGHSVQQLDARGNSQRTTYNVQGQPTSQVDERNIVTKVFGYTADGLRQSVWEPDNNSGTTAQNGSVNLANPSSTHSRTEYREYDSRMVPARVYAASMNIQAGPGSGALTRYEYNDQGKPTRITLPPDQSGATATIEQTYDNLGNVLTLKDANGFPTSFTYDWAGRLISKHEQARPGNQTDIDAGLQNGLRGEYRYDTAGNLTYKEERGLITEYRYNSLGKVIHESRPRVGAGTATNWKLRTYRLDGLKTAETSYDYSGNLTSRPDVVQFGDSSVSVNTGNLTISEYNGRGDLWGRGSFGPGRFNESSMWQYVDGLGNRYKRVFVGHTNIYAEQRTAGGEPLGHASVLTYWKFDPNSNLTEKWDTPSAGWGGWDPRDANDRQNVFTYTYSATNKEAGQSRTIQVKYRSQVPNNSLNTTYGSNGVLVAASEANTTTSYTERDQIEKATTTDKTPYLDGNNPTQQGVLGGAITRHQRYAYYADGRVQNSWTGDGTTDTAYKGVESYDQRGRELAVYDSNGGLKKTAPARTSSTYGTDGSVFSKIDQSGYTVYTVNTAVTVGGLTASSVVFNNPSNYVKQQSTTTTTYSYANGSALTGVPYSIRFSTGSCFENPETGINPCYTQNNAYSAYGELIRSTDANGVPAYSATYNGGGSMTGETRGNINITYVLDSRGNRLSVSGGNESGYVKRYDADDRVAQFNNLNNNAVSTTFCSDKCYGVGNRYNDFRYDPLGQQVLSSTAHAQIEEQNAAPWLQEHGVWRDVNSTTIVNGEAQLILRKAGNYIWKCKQSWSGSISCSLWSDTYRNNAPQYRDAAYSLADGYNDDTTWDGTKPFAVTASVEQLDAPLQTLSSTLKINPLDLAPPTLPKLPDPSQIQQGEGVQAKDAPVTTEQVQKINPPSQDKHPADLQGGTQGTRQAKPRDGAVLIQEVPANFDDGEGFQTAVYAVATLATSSSTASSGAPKSVGSKAVADDIQAKTQVEQNKKSADSLEQLLKDKVDSMTFVDSSGNNITPKVRKSINDTLAWSHDVMSPEERLGLYVGIFAALDQGYSMNNKGDIGISGKTSETLGEMGGALRRLGNNPKNNELLKGALLATAAAIYADHQYKTMLADAALAVLTMPTAGDIEGLFGLIATAGKGVKSLARRGAARALPGLVKGIRPAREIGAEVLEGVIKGCNSFTPSTPVRTLSGLIAISALTVGTPVLAYNEQTGENGYYPITAVHKNTDPEITYLAIQDPEQGNKLEYIQTTPEHPFYVKAWSDTGETPKPVGHEDLGKNWVGAGHLKIGDKIKQADGTTGVVANVVTLGQTREMFNLTVSEAHTFYVGRDGWLVHNGGNGISSVPKGYILYHYTDEAGAKAIMESGKLLPDARGRVFLTPDQVPASHAKDALFAGNPRYAGKGAYVIEVRVLPETGLGFDPTKATQYNELVHNGTLRNGRQIEIVSASRNTFTEYVSRVASVCP